VFSHHWYSAWRHEEDRQAIGPSGISLNMWRLTVRSDPLGSLRCVFTYQRKEHCALLVCILHVCDVRLGPGDACLYHERVGSWLVMNT